MLTVSVIFSTMLAISTGVSASELNESIISLLQTVVEGKFVIGPKGTEEEAPNVEDGKFVIGPVSEDGVLGNVVEGNLVIGPFDVEGNLVIGPNDVEGKFVIGPFEGIDVAVVIVVEGNATGPLFEGIEVEVVEEGGVSCSCVASAGENQAISATAAKITEGAR